ncbi:MAG: M20/M25/M40 family metallo-hydrolase [Nitrospirota bacterium]
MTLRKAFYAVAAIAILLSLSVSPLLSSEAPRTVHNDPIIHHDLKVALYPKSHSLKVTDTITLPSNRPARITFYLHKGLNPSSRSRTSGVVVTKKKSQPGNFFAEAFSVRLPSDVNTFSVSYEGAINHPIEQYGKEYARGISQTPGLISDDGVYLEGGSYWYPRFDDEFVTFSLSVELPSSWDAVSQGQRTEHSRKEIGTKVEWDSPEIQEEIYLVAGKFTEYTKEEGRVKAMVFLRSPDKELAEKYLGATVQYISLYEKLIGPYPFLKFALVENFWETGLGMPSFTLLGPKVIRFPFIIKSSYPHEILHSWWGNSVFPDYEKGNWSEGLTAYLADHLLKEQENGGAEYRMTTLQKYADYVLYGKDFPIVEFRSRHSSVSEAIGYGKSMMFFHMLRLQIGDKTFVAWLQDFYRKNKFRIASFADLQKSFEAVSGKNLDREFSQWIERTGAPELKLENARTWKSGEEHILTAKIEQVQVGEPYVLHIPVAVTMREQKRAFQTTVVMDRKTFELRLKVPSRPQRLDVDPEFDLFRRPDIEETPPAISQALGSARMLVILPSSADTVLLQAYKRFTETLKTAGPEEVEIRLDNEVKQIPKDRAVTVLGWKNRFSEKVLSALLKYDVSMKRNKLLIGAKEFETANTTVVLTARDPVNKNVALTLIASNMPSALPGLGRKLPHYHKYSWLVFRGEEPENIARDRWPVVDSPMTVLIPDEKEMIVKVDRGELAPRKPLAELPLLFSSSRMLDTVRYLSSDELEGRGFGSRGIDAAADFIAKKFKEAGLKPLGDSPDSYFQTWEDSGGEPETKKRLKNVVGIIPGKKKEFDGQSIIIGAHYDHLGTGWPDVREENKGKIHPGADDNASGVAVLLELAQHFGKNAPPDRSIIFVAFAGEETGKKGSRRYVEKSRKTDARYPAEQTIAMVNIDTVGRLEKNKLLILGGNSAQEWVHIFRGAGFVSGVDVEMVSEELDSSDQISFQQAGVPAVQLFTGAHADYHRPTDTADKIDADGLVKVAAVASEAIEHLTKRESRLTSAIKPAEGVEKKGGEKRKVSMGIVPDFSYQGKGIRLSGTIPGSPAEKSGLKEGDILNAVNTTPVNSLKDLSAVLNSLQPGSRSSLTIFRDGQEMTVESEVVER